MIQSFRDLKVWQKAHELVLGIYKITKEFPAEEKYVLVPQLRRAAVSVSANIVEGGKKSTKDYIRFLEIADGSLEETKYHLLLSRDLGYLAEPDYQRLTLLADDVGRLLCGLRRSLKNR